MSNCSTLQHAYSDVPCTPDANLPTTGFDIAITVGIACCLLLVGNALRRRSTR